MNIHAIYQMKELNEIFRLHHFSPQSGIMVGTCDFLKTALREGVRLLLVRLQKTREMALTVNRYQVKVAGAHRKRLSA